MLRQGLDAKVQQMKAQLGEANSEVKAHKKQLEQRQQVELTVPYLILPTCTVVPAGGAAEVWQPHPTQDQPRPVIPHQLPGNQLLVLMSRLFYV